MNIQDYYNTSYLISGKASDLNRQLGFAAIAVIWIFRSRHEGNFSIPDELILAGTLAMFSLLLDMAHYLVSAFTWRGFAQYHEGKKTRANKTIRHPPYLELPIFVLFTAKILAMMACYGFILIFLIRTLHVNEAFARLI